MVDSNTTTDKTSRHNYQRGIGRVQMSKTLREVSLGESVKNAAEKNQVNTRQVHGYMKLTGMQKANVWRNPSLLVEDVEDDDEDVTRCVTDGAECELSSSRTSVTDDNSVDGGASVVTHSMKQVENLMKQVLQLKLEKNNLQKKLCQAKQKNIKLEKKLQRVVKDKENMVPTQMWVPKHGVYQLVISTTREHPYFTHEMNENGEAVGIRRLQQRSGCSDVTCKDIIQTPSKHLRRGVTCKFQKAFVRQTRFVCLPLFPVSPPSLIGPGYGVVT